MDPAALPPEIAHTMGAAAAIAGIIRSLVAIMRTPLFREVWTKLPWWAKPTMLLAATAALGTADAIGFGQPWYLAIGSALTGLGGAVVTHEWQDLFKEAREAKAGEEALAAESIAHTPPNGIATPPDTVPDGKPVSKP